MLDEILLNKKTKTSKVIKTIEKASKHVKKEEPKNNKSKICKVCGHEACPGCYQGWCDTMNADGTLCCNGKCTYD